MKHQKTNSLPGLLVFGLFALCLLLVLLTGAKVYRQTLADTEAASETRTKLQLLSTKVRQSPDAQPGTFDGCPALILREDIDGECYVTYLYVHEGFLRELFCPEGAVLTAGDGEILLPAQVLAVSRRGRLLTVTIDGHTLYLTTEGR